MSMSVEECGAERPPRAAPSIPDNVLEQFSLKGRVCAVSGASGGIGSAVAEAYAEAGAHVALWYNSNPAAKDVAERLSKTHGIKAIAYQVDVSDPTKVKDAVQKVVDDFGKLDVFVANAGMPNSKTLLDMPLDEVKQLNAVNLDSVVYCAKFAGAVFKKQGSGNLIITSSISAHIVNVPVDQPVSLLRRHDLYEQPFDDYPDLQRDESLYKSSRQVSRARMARVRKSEYSVSGLLQHGHGRFRSGPERSAQDDAAEPPGRDKGDQRAVSLSGERCVELPDWQRRHHRWRLHFAMKRRQGRVAGKMCRRLKKLASSSVQSSPKGALVGDSPSRNLAIPCFRRILPSSRQ
jgi:NAD(P)-dependent dehydrogenase (short-subunit alcohol dehydrogenase family)